jgi:GH24 family phage-related lysozyme (muramidase)
MTIDNRIKVALAIATAVAIPAEGLRQYAYRDPPGILTVCYGSTQDVQPGKRYSLEECTARLNNDMRTAVSQVERCVPGLPAPALAAFGDAVYNLGPRIVCDPTSSTAARHLKQGRLRDACEQLPRWNRATVAGVSVELPGLTKRRAAERALCLTALS